MEQEAVSRLLTRPGHGDHLVQLYEDESRLLRALEWYVLSGLEGGGAVVTIATEVRQRELERRLGHRGLEIARRDGRFIALRAEDVMVRFMVDGWPVARLFEQVLSEVLARARAGRSRPVRAYGEMVALLMAQGNLEATLRLEQLWTSLLEREGIALFCGYPRSVFGDDSATLRLVCDAHTHVLPA